MSIYILYRVAWSPKIQLKSSSVGSNTMIFYQALSWTHDIYGANAYIVSVMPFVFPRPNGLVDHIVPWWFGFDAFDVYITCILNPIEIFLTLGHFEDVTTGYLRSCKPKSSVNVTLNSNPVNMILHY